MKLKKSEIRLKGVPISPGIAIGKPFFFTLLEDDVQELVISSKDVEKEIKRYQSALLKSREDILLLQKKLKKEHILEGAQILDTHLEMMQDPLLTDCIDEGIRKTNKNAEFVLRQAINQYHKKFQSMADPLIRERFKDILDVYRRIMAYLREGIRVSLSNIASNSIVFSHDLTASDAAEASSGTVDCFVTEKGGATSHAAIVAKAKGIPYITDVNFDLLPEVEEKDLVIVDGRTGEIIFSPKQKTLKSYGVFQKQLEGHFSALSKDRQLPAETIDGHRIKLSANIDRMDEIDTFYKTGGDGVGLFRSEYVFITSDTLPTEEKQYQIYRQLIKKMNGQPIVIRTFDFGGDKLILSRYIPFDENHFLGTRAIRFLLKEKDIFKAQLRAILRASKEGNVSVMFPMISSLQELVEAKEILFEAKEELESCGIAIPSTLRVGCMIEVPSAAIIADLLAKESDFLSIGTNDLTQYSLAVDRRNPSSTGFFAPTDPSVLRMIKLVVSEANQQGIPVTICGEVAADPRFTALLTGLGVKELSVSPRYIPVIKRVIRNMTIVEANHLAETALSLTNSKQILELLTDEYQRMIPEDRFYNCFAHNHGS